MADRERRNGPEEPSPATHEQDKAKDEQQVIEPRQDVLEAQSEVVPHHVETTDPGRHGENGLVAAQHHLDQAAVGQGDPDKRVGSALAQTVDADSLTDETLGATVDAPA